jgi:hypothetical protein
MRRLSFILTLLIYVLTFYPKAGIGQWKQKEFIVGAFYDPQISNCKLDDTLRYKQLLKGVKDCNFNLLSGLDGCYDFKFIDFKLGLLSELNLQTLQLNMASSQKKNVNFNQGKADEWIKFVAGLSPEKKKALYGYFIYDEPYQRDEKSVRGWMGYVKARDPSRLAYLNLAPVYVYKDEKEDYEKYLDTYLNPSSSAEKPDVVSYDFYPFVKSGLRKDYFYNLSVLRKKAAERPLWYCVLTTQHGEYKAIGKYELNFMTFAPLIYGAKGVFYFTYQTIIGSTMPYGEAITLKGNPTSKYYQVKQMNYFLRAVWGPLVMNSSYKGTYHASAQPYSQSAVPQGEIINGRTPLISKLGNASLALGIFQSLVNREEYNVIVVNKSSSSLKQIPIVIKGNATNNVSVSLPYASIKDAKSAFLKTKTSYNRSSNSTTIWIDFLPGDARIIRIAGVYL